MHYVKFINAYNIDLLYSLHHSSWPPSTYTTSSSSQLFHLLLLYLFWAQYTNELNQGDLKEHELWVSHRRMDTLSMFTFQYSISLPPLSIFKFQELPGERWNLKSPSTTSKHNYYFWVFRLRPCDPPWQNTEGSNLVHVLGRLLQLLKRPHQARRHSSVRLLFF